MRVGRDSRFFFTHGSQWARKNACKLGQKGQTSPIVQMRKLQAAAWEGAGPARSGDGLEKLAETLDGMDLQGLTSGGGGGGGGITPPGQ